MEPVAARSLAIALALCVAPAAFAQTPDPNNAGAPPPAADAPSSAAPGAASPPADLPPPAPMPPLPPAAPALMVMAPPPPPPPSPPKATVGAKFAADIYGFVEFDAIRDSTQSYNEVAGNGAIAKKGTYAGDHGRTTYSGRNSRLGVKLKGPESDEVRTSAQLEMDFLGNQPPTVSESALISSPTFRMRHYMLKLETPYVDIMAGQYWALFGWGSYFFPNTVEIMGLPGQVFNRSEQFRVSHVFKTDAVNIEIAAASVRSPQRDGGVPDTQAGLRVLFNQWRGIHTANSTGTAIDAAGLGVSGVYRHLNVNNLDGTNTSKSKDAGGISIDALLPIVPVTGTDRTFGLTLTASYIRGTGIADLFTGLTGGVSNAAAPNPNMVMPAPTYTPNIDSGIVIYNAAGELHTIDWQSIIGGLQFYLPGDFWISGNYSQMDSHNVAKLFPANAKVFDHSQWADGNLFWDVNKAMRLGAEVAWFKQRYTDASTSHNWRGQFSAFYLF